MELKDVNEKVAWEARRVAAAFGVARFDVSEEDGVVTCIGQAETTQIWCNISLRTCSFIYIEVADLNSPGCYVYSERIWPSGIESRWCFSPNSTFHEQMVRGLYRLGFEEESVLCQLPSLSAHEKLELRLSMPREFWPQKWLDGEQI